MFILIETDINGERETRDHTLVLHRDTLAHGPFNTIRDAIAYAEHLNVLSAKELAGWEDGKFEDYHVPVVWLVKGDFEASGRLMGLRDESRTVKYHVYRIWAPETEATFWAPETEASWIRSRAENDSDL